MGFIANARTRAHALTVGPDRQRTTGPTPYWSSSEEYLASGRPIVGTPIRSLLDFAHVIKLASTQEEWSRALTASLAPDAVSSDQVQKRRSIARQVDWGTLVQDIARSMCNRLGPPYREQFSGLNLETS